MEELRAPPMEGSMKWSLAGVRAALESLYSGSAIARALLGFVPSLGLLSIFAGALLPIPAFACRGPTLETTIFFEDVPDDIGSDVAAHITLTEVANASPADPFWHRGTARVNAVLKGALPSKTVTIISPATDCDRRLVAGSEGIVIGAPRKTPAGSFELIVRTESFQERELRARRAKKK
jgi:hypothetical protein